MHGSRTANLLGATALAVTDLAHTTSARGAGLNPSSAAALTVLLSSAEVSVTELGRRVGLTQSAAARMVDSLQADRLVERQHRPGRWVPVRLTAAGRDTALSLLAARNAPLTEALVALDHDEQQTLAELLAKLLTGLYGRCGDANQMCRLCDREACTTEATCPVGEAERERAPA